MNSGEALTVLGAFVLTAMLGRFFFGPKRSHRTTMEAGVQVVTVTVKGLYSRGFGTPRPGHRRGGRLTGGRWLGVPAGPSFYAL